MPATAELPAPTAVGSSAWFQRMVELSRYAAGAVEPLDPAANVQ